MSPLSKEEEWHAKRLALLRAYQRDAKDYALYAKRAQTDRMRRYWHNAEHTVLRLIARLEKKDET